MERYIMSRCRIFTTKNGLEYAQTSVATSAALSCLNESDHIAEIAVPAYRSSRRVASPSSLLTRSSLRRHPDASIVHTPPPAKSP
jgi:hypothetical protein